MDIIHCINRKQIKRDKQCKMHTGWRIYLIDEWPTTWFPPEEVRLLRLQETRAILLQSFSALLTHKALILSESHWTDSEKWRVVHIQESSTKQHSGIHPQGIQQSRSTADVCPIIRAVSNGHLLNTPQIGVQYAEIYGQKNSINCQHQ